MGFESLLVNERLKANLAESLAKKLISHFYLISGPEGSGKHTLARLLSAAILSSFSRVSSLMRTEMVLWPSSPRFLILRGSIFISLILFILFYLYINYTLTNE